MSPRLLVPALALLVFPATIRAEDEDPTLRNRHLSEWLKMLREDPAAEHRRAALLATELIGPGRSPKVVPAIIGTLRDDADDKLREAAAAALGRIAERLAAKPDSERPPFTAGRDALVGALRTDRAARVRAAAAGALGRLDRHEATGAVADLASVLRSTESPLAVRLAAAEALHRIGSDTDDAVGALKDTLADSTADPALRTRAALALGNVGGRGLAALPALLSVLNDPHAPVELLRADVETVGRLGGEAASAANRLGDLLVAKDSGVDLRRAIVGTLDRFGADGRPALPGLRKALQDDDRFVRTLALHAIGQQGEVLGTESHVTVSAVLGCLGDRVVEVRVAAAETLSALGPNALGPDSAAARERLQQAGRDGQKAVRDAAEQALKRLSAAP